ncbi:hypothetical protein B0H14DRAFT_3654671 [Mycena olivaceomarginata]|nr:hypothetical protein B0H14DRAFT_3654671 [Mycena olivaceomarginata]
MEGVLHSRLVHQFPHHSFFPTNIVKSPDDWSTPHSSTVDVSVTAAHPVHVLSSRLLASLAPPPSFGVRCGIYVPALINEYRYPTSLAYASIFELERPCRAALALFLDTLCLDIGVRGVPGTLVFLMHTRGRLDQVAASSITQGAPDANRSRRSQMKDGRGTRKAFEGGRQFSDSGGPLNPPSVVAYAPLTPTRVRRPFHHGLTPPSIFYPPPIILLFRFPLPLHPTQLLPVPLLPRRHLLRSARLVRHGANLSNTASFFVQGSLTWSFFPGTPPASFPHLHPPPPRRYGCVSPVSPRGGATSSPSLHLRVAHPHRPSASLCDGPNLASAPSPSAYMRIAHATARHARLWQSNVLTLDLWIYDDEHEHGLDAIPSPSLARESPVRNLGPTETPSTRSQGYCTPSRALSMIPIAAAGAGPAAASPSPPASCVPPAPFLSAFVRVVIAGTVPRVWAYPCTPLQHHRSAFFTSTGTVPSPSPSPLARGSILPSFASHGTAVRTRQDIPALFRRRSCGSP